MRYTILFIALLFFTGACKKYARLEQVNSPAYIRVFNSIVNNPTILNNGNLNNYLTFLLDPGSDSGSIPKRGAVVGDYLATRNPYTISYPTDAANSVAGSGKTNYEYPGREPVLTAPPINGFDMSSWAQVSSGRHRIVFVSRPSGEVPFDSLTLVQRGRVIVDTTVDLKPGEVYTIQAVLQNEDAHIYGAYIREETFTHEQFSSDSIYINFYNLSARINATEINPYSVYFNWFKDTLNATGIAYRFNNDLKTFDTVPGFTNVKLSLREHFSQTGPYMTFPLLPQSAFFDNQGNLGRYGNIIFSPNAFNIDPGTLPYITLRIDGLNSSLFEAWFRASPVSYNFNVLYQANTWHTEFYPGFIFLPNLNLISSIGDKTTVHGTVNILEIVNTQIFLTQLQKGFGRISQN